MLALLDAVALAALSIRSVPLDVVQSVPAVSGYPTLYHLFTIEMPLHLVVDDSYLDTRYFSSWSLASSRR